MSLPPQLLRTQTVEALATIICLPLLDTAVSLISAENSIRFVSTCGHSHHDIAQSSHPSCIIVSVIRRISKQHAIGSSPSP